MTLVRRWLQGLVPLAFLFSVNEAQFSSNVVELNSRNWRTEVEESPLAVFVNICRQWEKLAEATKGTIKVAYYDTEQAGRRPSLLGEIKGTPTIRLYVPKPKQKPADSVSKKNVLDYQYERKAADLKRFAEENMPNFLERIQGTVTKFEEKAIKYELPRAYVFTSKAKTLALTKYLSTEFRRRMLIAEVHPTKPNQKILEQFGITDLPAVLVIPPGEDATPIRYEGDGFKRHKLHSFLSQHALKKKVMPKKKEKEDPPADETDTPPVSAKTEL